MALVGKNGTGKSSLLKAIAGLDSLVQGEITLKNVASTFKNNYFPSEIVSYIPVKLMPFGAVSLADFILSGKSMSRNFMDIPSQQEVEHVSQLLERFSMRHMALDSFDLLSDGEQKLALIMRSVYRDAEVLLIDEPESFLDVGNRKMIFQWLKTLAQQGKTIIFSTHQPELAAQFIDSFLVIQKEKIVFRPTKDLNEILEVLS